MRRGDSAIESPQMRSRIINTELGSVKQKDSKFPLGKCAFSQDFLKTSENYRDV